MCFIYLKYNIFGHRDFQKLYKPFFIFTVARIAKLYFEKMGAVTKTIFEFLLFSYVNDSFSFLLIHRLIGEELTILLAYI